MSSTILWLISVVIAFAGVGIGLMYQGKALMNPDDSKEIGRKMNIVGWWWIGIAIFWLIIALLLDLLVFKG